MSKAGEIVHVIGELGEFDAPYQMRELARNQVNTGSSVTIVVLSGNRSDLNCLSQQGIATQIVHSRWPWDPFAAWQLVRLLLRVRPGIVHLWGETAVDFAAVIRWAFPQVKLIATLPAIPDSPGWLACKTLSAITTLVVDHLGESRRPATVIPPGVNLEAFTPPAREEVLAGLGLSLDAQLIGLVSPLTQSDQLEEAIWNFELVRTLHERAALVILGCGPDRDRLARYARLMSEPAVIRFVEPGPDWRAVLAHSSVCWQPGEPAAIPTALLSALALGVPVMARDTAIHRLVVSEGENGFLAPHRSRSLWTRRTGELLQDAELRARLIAAGQQTVRERFPLGEMLRSYERLYE